MRNACSTHTYNVGGMKRRESIETQLGTRAHAFIVVLLLVVNMYILNRTVQRALKPSQGKQLGYCAHENERPRSAAKTAERRQKRLTKRRDVGLGALPRLPMHKFV